MSTDLVKISVKEAMHMGLYYIQKNNVKIGNTSSKLIKKADRASPRWDNATRTELGSPDTTNKKNDHFAKECFNPVP